jgi:hypothetical protein
MPQARLPRGGMQFQIFCGRKFRSLMKRMARQNQAVFLIAAIRRRRRGAKEINSTMPDCSGLKSKCPQANFSHHEMREARQKTRPARGQVTPRMLYDKPLTRTAPSKRRMPMGRRQAGPIVGR